MLPYNKVLSKWAASLVASLDNSLAELEQVMDEQSMGRPDAASTAQYCRVMLLKRRCKKRAQHFRTHCACMQLMTATL